MAVTDEQVADMLDQIDLNRTIDAHEYQRRLPLLQDRFYAMEQLLLEARTPVLLVFEGWAGTSKIGVIGQLTRRLDPRGVRVYSITPPRTSETMYPWLYRFWLKIPSYGEITIFDRSWYRQVLADRTQEDLDGTSWRSRCEDIVSFERQLAEDGTIILKFWLHISKHEQQRRFRKLLKNRLTAWRVTEEDRWQHRHYGRVRSAAEDLIARTDTPAAPWLVLSANNHRYLRIAVFEAILHRVEAALGTAPPSDFEDAELFDSGGPIFRHTADELKLGPHTSPAPAALLAPGLANGAQLPALRPAQPVSAPSELSMLRRVDLSLKLDEKTYDRKLAKFQAKLGLLGFQVYRQKRPLIIVFEGWDAAGKGGAIQRITSALDPRGYVVHTIAAPAGEDRARHYLYRFWRRLPTAGAIAIFDRSWYGRVLVERVEGFARPDEWRRAYGEINEFERQLIESGAIVCKFWLHLSPDEQLRRFEGRQSVPYKAWKLTDEDWRNRAKWGEYEQATDEMLLRTSTPTAPWTIVEAEDKRFARVKILRTLVHRLEDELGKVKL